MALVRKFTRRKKYFLTKIDIVHVNLILVYVDINNSHVNIIMMHVDINKSHVYIIMLHVDIISLACRGQKYTTILSCLKNLRLFLYTLDVMAMHGVGLTVCSTKNGKRCRLSQMIFTNPQILNTLA